MKKNNPHTPIMLREALGTEPRVFARYGKSILRESSGDMRLTFGAEYGNEKQESLNGRCIRMYLSGIRLTDPGLNDKEIEDTVTGLVKTRI